MPRQHVAIVIAFLAFTDISAAQTPVSPTTLAENTGPNANITRWARGTYEYRTISDQRLRGTENWQLFVYRDGSRTMIMWHDLFATNTQFTGIMRVDQQLRPLDAFVEFWTQGKFKGAGTITFADGKITLNSIGSQGAVTQTAITPNDYSISLHPLASDWWHYWYYDRTKAGSQISRYYSLEAGRDVGLPVTVRLIETEQADAGDEQITVPAGTFKATKYTSGTSAAWIAGPDAMLVKSSAPKSDREYVLTKLETGTNEVKK
jgi:hypothetical protein